MTIQESVGWWEWVLLPGLSRHPIKAKCDTGATLSALHAEDLEVVTVGDIRIARFTLIPGEPQVELTISEQLQIKSSNGEAQNRPVVLVPIEFAGRVFAIQCTLTDRTPMAYPMLMGRNALAGQFLVDSSKARLHRKPRVRAVR